MAYKEDNENFETIIGTDGKPMRILKDGGRARVSFFDAQAARQPLTDTERFVLEDAYWRERSRANRPGFRLDISDAGKERRQAVRDAYMARDQEQAEAWRGGAGVTGFGVNPDGPVGQREHDLCTVNGRPGRLRYNANGELQCYPDYPAGSEDRRTLDEKMDDHALRMQEEYDQYSRQQSEAYKTLR
jgi:hypothetical protein